jgi:hypothetical protein
VSAVSSGTHNNTIYAEFHENNPATVNFVKAIENSPSYVPAHGEHDGQAVIRACFSHDNRAYCGSFQAWVNTAGTAVTGRGCSTWDATQGRDCAYGGGAWAEVPCDSEPAAVCSTSTACSDQCIVIPSNYTAANYCEGTCRYPHAGITVCCPEGQTQYGDGSACEGGGRPRCKLFGNPGLVACPYRNCGGLEIEVDGDSSYPIVQNGDMVTVTVCPYAPNTISVWGRLFAWLSGTTLWCSAAFAVNGGGTDDCLDATLEMGIYNKNATYVGTFNNYHEKRRLNLSGHDCTLFTGNWAQPRLHVQLLQP